MSVRVELELREIRGIYTTNLLSQESVNYNLIFERQCEDYVN
jgi:hypothetical protein